MTGARRLVAALAATTLATAVVVPVLLPARAAAATLEPSGLQTGMAVDGTTDPAAPPETFNWGDFITDVQPDSSFTFTPTGPYVTEQWNSSTGVVQGSFDWDNGSAGAACNANPDPTGAPPSQSPGTNPWRPGPSNPNAKGDLCSTGYGVEVVTDAAGARHPILYGYWTRYVGNGEVSVFQHLEGPGPGRCDDVLLEFNYASSGTTVVVERWVAAAGDGCADPLGAGTWVVQPGGADFDWSVGVRDEGPPLTNQSQETFGEFAIDLASAGLFSADLCSTFHVSEMFTRTGNSESANIQDFADHTPDRLSISNCGSVTVTKETDPGVTGTGHEFGFTVASDTGPVQPGPPVVETLDGVVAAGETVTYEDVLAGTGYSLAETDVPPPWAQESVVCTAVPPAGGPPQQYVLDDPSDRFPVTPENATDCVITNSAAVVTVTKQTVPDGAEGDFTFDVTGQDAVTLADGESASFPVPAGAPVTLTEGAADGWLPPEIACTADADVAERSATVVPVAGQEIECTFTNTRLGTVVVSKEAHGVDGRTFDFTSDIPGGEEFAIEVEQGDGTLYEEVITDVPAGTYTIEELTDDGDPATVLADLACTYGGADHSGDPATRTIDLTVLPGETVRCFFTNTLPGSITVIKRTVPVEYDQEFDFVHTPPGGDPEPFTLNGNSVPPNLALRTFLDLDAGVHTITEPADEPGWSLTDLDCTADFWAPTADGRGVEVDLPAGGVVVCFFTNAADAATASVTKTVAGGGPDLSWTFDLELVDPDGTVVSRTATSGSPTVEWDGLVPGVEYTLREGGTTPAGWTRGEITCVGLTDLSPAPGFQLVLSPGQVLDCGAENAVASSSISVAKVATGIGADQPWAFDLSIDPVPVGGTSPQTVSGTGHSGRTVTWSGLAPGQAYSITEEQVPGWTGDVECDGVEDIDPGSPGLQFVAPVGASASCELVNTAVQGSGTLTKTAVGGDGEFELVLTDLDEAVDPVVVPVTTVDGTATVDLPQIVPGVRYSLVESGTDGWVQGALTCTVTPADGGEPYVLDDLGDFSVSPGDVGDCTAENLRTGTIVIEKSVTEGDGEFGFTGDWLDPPGFTIATEGGTGTRTSADVAPGSYTVTETPLPGFQGTGLTCVDGDPDGTPSSADGLAGSIELDPGETVTCTYTNAPWGSLSVAKTVAGWADDAPWAFDLVLTGPGGPVPLTVTDQEPVVTWPDLEPGAAYSLTEPDPGAGWSATLTCTGTQDDDPGADGFQFTATAATVVSCQAVNTAAPVDVSVTKTVAGADPGQEWSFDLVLTPGGAAEPGTRTVTGTGPGTATVSWTGLVAGSEYTVTEPDPGAGWTAGEVTCTGLADADPGTAGFQLVAEAGASVECAVANTAGQGPSPSPTPSPTPTPTPSPTPTPTSSPTPSSPSPSPSPAPPDGPGGPGGAPGGGTGVDGAPGPGEAPGTGGDLPLTGAGLGEIVSAMVVFLVLGSALMLGSRARRRS